jgi:hypothetical protein
MVGAHPGLDADNWRIDPDVLATPFEIPVVNATTRLATFLAGSIPLVVAGVSDVLGTFTRKRELVATLT